MRAGILSDMVRCRCESNQYEDAARPFFYSGDCEAMQASELKKSFENVNTSTRILSIA